MRPIFIFLPLAIALAQATPARADKYFAVTPSGTTEMVFPGKPEMVVGALSSKCIDVRWTVISSTSTELVCEAPLNMGQSIIGQMLMGNSYSTPPRRFYRFNVAELNGVSRVQASGWMELQMAFGQTKRTDFSGPPFHNGMMNFMGAAGGSYPVGTTFPNHAAMGVQVEQLQQGKFLTFRITAVETGSPAAKAGIQVGDVVTRIAGKPFKNTDDYLDATARAAAKSPYEVEFIRGGKTMKLSLERSFRPTWTKAVLAEATPTPAPASPPAPPSIADELEKLAKLKESGVLSESEFEAQKTKLLNH